MKNDRDSSLSGNDLLESSRLSRRGLLKGVVAGALQISLSGKVKGLPNNDFLRRLILRVESTDPNNLSPYRQRYFSSASDL